MASMNRRLRGLAAHSQHQSACKRTGAESSHVRFAQQRRQPASLWCGVLRTEVSSKQTGVEERHRVLSVFHPWRNVSICAQSMKATNY